MLFFFHPGMTSVSVFGAVACAKLLTGATLEDAVRSACHLAARNVTHRGATGLRDHLLGRLASV